MLLPLNLLSRMALSRITAFWNSGPTLYRHVSYRVINLLFFSSDWLDRFDVNDVSFSSLRCSAEAKCVITGTSISVSLGMDWTHSSSTYDSFT